MFVYKNRETIEYVQKQATCEQKYKLHGWVNNSIIMWRMSAKSQSIVLIKRKNKAKLSSQC